MPLRSFFKLVEIQTKVASVIPFLLGTGYALYRFQRFNARNFIFMLISLLAIDMATTAINNYYDYKRARKTIGYNYESHNAIVRDNLRETAVIATIFLLLSIAIAFGLMLYFHTNIIVLVLGAISFLIGILYSFGPVPISRTPLGELFSGILMGFVIVLISSYIHIYDQGIISLSYAKEILSVDMHLTEIIFIFLFSIPTVNGIANIMLANNICDIEDDLENRRYTLPIYIGKEKALKLFKILYYIVYVDVIILLLLKIAPIYSLLVLLTFIPVKKNIDLFYKQQSKKDTFVVSVKNFIMINTVQVIAIAISIIV